MEVKGFRRGGGRGLLTRRGSVFVLFLCVGLAGAWPAGAEQVFSYRQQIIDQALARQEMTRSGPEVREDAAPPDTAPSSAPALPAVAGESSRPAPAPALPRDQAVTEALNRLEIGLETFSFSYREPGLMKDKGILTGVYGIYTYRRPGARSIKTMKDAWADPVKVNRVSVEGRFAGGLVDYESEGTGTRDGLKFYTFELRGLLGYDMHVIPSGTVTPFFGVGFRYLKDDNGGKVSSTNNWFYDRESRYIYLPVGIEVSREFRNRWSVALTCEYDWFLSGKQKSHLGDGGPSILSADDGQWYVLDTLQNTQERGFGLRGSLKFTRTRDRWDFVVEPFVRYWKLEDSRWAQMTSESGSIFWYHDSGRQYPVYGYEPNNTTTEYGIKVGVVY